MNLLENWPTFWTLVALLKQETHKRQKLKCHLIALACKTHIKPQSTKFKTRKEVLKMRTTVTYTVKTNKQLPCKYCGLLCHKNGTCPARGRCVRPATKRTTMLAAVAVQRRELENRIHSQGESIKSKQRQI